MNKIIINLAIVSCFTLGAALAHASSEGSTSTQKASTAHIDYYETYDEHGEKQVVPGSGAEGVVHSSEPMEREEIKTNYRDPHSSVDGA